MPERLPPAEQLANLKKLQSEFEAAYAKGVKTGDAARAEELKTQIETGAVSLRESLDSRPNAERILGDNFISSEKVGGITDDDGVRVFAIPNRAPLKISAQELENEKVLGHERYWVPDAFTEDIVRKHGFPDGRITMQRLATVFTNKAHDGKPLLFSIDWYKNEAFFTTEALSAGYRSTSKEVVPGSLSKNYLQQTDLLVTYLRTNVFKNVPLPDEYAKAIAEYESRRDEIQALMTPEKWKDASEILSGLTITKLTRESPAEALYRLVLMSRVKQQKLLPSSYSWTSGRASGGSLVYVGRFDGHGAYVGRRAPALSDGGLGACFSRM